MRRVIALSVWAFGVWVLLTWTRTLEQLLVGAVIAVAVGAVLAPLGEVAAPWALLRPRRLIGLVVLLGVVPVRIVVANVKLARRIWAPSRPLASGMLIVPTTESSDGGLTAVGLITSLIVDNQLVDLDRATHRLQYHAVAVPSLDPVRASEAINAPLERRLRWMEGDHD